MKEIDDIIHRMKNLQKFVIITDLPDDFEFRGPVPFDMKIKNERVTADVWALTLEEAQQRVNEYLRGY